MFLEQNPKITVNVPQMKTQNSLIIQIISSSQIMAPQPDVQLFDFFFLSLSRHILLRQCFAKMSVIFYELWLHILGHTCICYIYSSHDCLLLPQKQTELQIIQNSVERVSSGSIF